MNRIHKVLMTLISMGVIMLVAVGMNRTWREYNDHKIREERYTRYAETQAQVREMEVEIAELSKDEEAIRNFLTENADAFLYDDVEKGWDMNESGTASDDGSYDTDLSDIGGYDTNSSDIRSADSDFTDSGISGNDLWNNGLSGGSLSGNSISYGDLSGNSLSGNGLFSDNRSGAGLSGNGLSGNSLSGNSLSGNSISDNYMPYAGLTYHDITDIIANDITDEFGTQTERIEAILERRRSGKLTLNERRKLQGSYMETLQINQTDKRIIAQNQIDFTDMKIACLGDSITAASNLEKEADYQQYSYPARLQKLLGAAGVENYGIGGSSIGRYWDQAFVDRYRAIPADTDLILVMGGTNDGFCATEEEIGTLEERKQNTFAGDLDELMKGLKRHYPDATIIFATPLPNILHDILRKDRDYLLPQEKLVNIINQLGAEHQIPVIDLYNSNLLDSHDAANIHNFLPDGVHCNPAGYQILAEHFAAEVIKLYNQSDNVEN